MLLLAIIISLPLLCWPSHVAENSTLVESTIAFSQRTTDSPLSYLDSLSTNQRNLFEYAMSGLDSNFGPPFLVCSSIVTISQVILGLNANLVIVRFATIFRVVRSRAPRPCQEQRHPYRVAHYYKRVRIESVSLSIFVMVVLMVIVESNFNIQTLARYGLGLSKINQTLPIQAPYIHLSLVLVST